MSFTLLHWPGKLNFAKNGTYNYIENNRHRDERKKRRRRERKELRETGSEREIWEYLSRLNKEIHQKESVLSVNVRITMFISCPDSVPLSPYNTSVSYPFNSHLGELMCVITKETFLLLYQALCSLPNKVQSVCY